MASVSIGTILFILMLFCVTKSFRCSLQNMITNWRSVLTGNNIVDKLRIFVLCEICCSLGIINDLCDTQSYGCTTVADGVVVVGVAAQLKLTKFNTGHLNE